MKGALRVGGIVGGGYEGIAVSTVLESDGRSVGRSIDVVVLELKAGSVGRGVDVSSSVGEVVEGVSSAWVVVLVCSAGDLVRWVVVCSWSSFAGGSSAGGSSAGGSSAGGLSSGESFAGGSVGLGFSVGSSSLLSV